MTKKVDPKSPASIGDVSKAHSTSLFITGGIIARVLPLYVRHPVTDEASLNRLIEALKSLGNELAQESPVFSVAFMDGIIGELLENPEKIYPDIF